MCLAIPARVLSVSGDEAVVSVGGVGRTVSLLALGPAAVGDYLLVHAGFAIERLDPEEAEATLALFREIAATLPPEGTA